MITKDYYKILDVKPSARAGEIKRNYRRLAMKYHPDKNGGDSLAAEVFSELAEAYNVLSNPQKRQEYNQSRYGIYDEGTYQRPSITKESLLAEVNTLQQKIASLDPFRLNRDALYYSILQVLSPEATIFLNAETDVTYKRLIIEKILQCSKLLTLTEINKIAAQLSVIAKGDSETLRTINTCLHSANNKNFWKRYQVWLVVILAICLALLIFFIGR